MSTTGTPPRTRLRRNVDASLDDTAQRSRRRFARRIRARRWMRWRRVVAVVLAIGLIGFAIHAVYFSDRLTVRDIEVSGLVELTADDVLAAAEVPKGEQLARLDTGAIELRVESLARVEEASVNRRWPRGVDIEVVERTPLAVISIGGRLRAIDDEGVVFGGYRRAPDDLPRIVTDTGGRTEELGTDALVEVTDVVGSLGGDIAARVDFVTVTSIDEITLTLGGGAVVKWGSAERSADKSRVLAALLVSAGENVSTYDVTVPEQPSTS